VKRILFITWDGPQVTYLRGLFLPIFAALRAHGYEFCILQFTWGPAGSSDSAGDACAKHGIPYRRADVWRAGAARAFLTAASGSRHIDRAVRDWNVDALMPRSLLPGLATLLSKSSRQRPIVFDSDGLAADERVDFAGLNPRGIIYRLLRWIEVVLVRRASIVLVRTKATIPILIERAGSDEDTGKFHVVTNGRDVAPFLAAPANERRITGPRLCYLGSIGPQYQPRTMLALARSIKRDFPQTTLSIFTRDQGAVRTYLSDRELEGERWIEVRSLDPGEVPAMLARHDVGIALRTPSLSMRAVAPIKVGDYLLAGLAIIGNPDVGPVEEMVEQGCLIAADAGADAIKNWIADVLGNRSVRRERCRRLGIENFSLERSVNDYRDALNCLEK
jgi:glycosyltransferase involved in cell wall biosynthesis